MALKSDDILLVQRGTKSYQMPASQLGGTDFITGDLQAVTDKGNTTTNGAEFGGEVLATGTSGYFKANRTEGTVWVSGSATPAVLVHNDGNQQTIALNWDGTATFVGNVNVSGITSDNTILVDRTGATQTAFQANLSGVKKAEIQAGGSAEFAGGDITLNADGSSDFKGRVTIQRDTDTDAGLIIKDAAGNDVHILYGTGAASFGQGKIALSASGMATFQDDVVVGVGGFGNNIELFSDGNIRVRNTVQAGPNAWENDRNGVRMSESGLLEINHHNSSPESTSALTLRRAGTVTAQILGGGIAQFLGPLTGGSSSDISSSPAGTTQGVIGVASDATNANTQGAIVGRNLVAGGRVFCGVTSEGTQVTTSEIFENGSASFEGAVKGSMTSITDGGAWNLKSSNFWTAAGGTLANPSNVEEAQTGVIYVAAELNAFGNQFSFPGGVTPTIPANSVVPYYVDVDNKIRLGLATEAFV